MPYTIKKVKDKVGVYKASNKKLVRKFKTKAIAKKMIKIWDQYEKRK
tara:strand:+ start:5634 stop:5774 length:141 start_codon:yes stop_codon:yes gene_type:complete